MAGAILYTLQWVHNTLEYTLHTLYVYRGTSLIRNPVAGDEGEARAPTPPSPSAVLDEMLYAMVLTPNTVQPISTLGAVSPRGGQERDFFSDNLLVRIHFVAVMSRWTDLAPWEFKFPCIVSLISTFLQGRS